MIRTMLIGAALMLGAAPILPAFAPAQAAVAEYGDQARDHAAILKMVGTWKVTFDMRETTPLVAGYTPYPAKVSGGHELVRAIVDTPNHVVLQHILVVDDGNGQTMVVKHWRQDWTWQPATVLVYSAANTWALQPVPAAERQGAWSQTVWQTDDSPRYGGVGRWRYDDGVTRWTGDETRRPLARRDATRHPPYDHYIGVNHHVLTPTGWVHEQENAKVGTKDGKSVTFVHEYVINTYAPDPAYDVSKGEAYWARTRDYWASVRDGWDREIAKHKGLHLTEEADSGSSTGHELMLTADDIVSGEIKLDQAKKEADALIVREVSK